MNSNIKHIKVIIAGGGTGGHIFPAIAIANALKHLMPQCEILFVGAKGKMEMEKVPREGYTIVGLDIAGYNRNSWWKNLGLPFKIFKSFAQARKILREFKPDVVIGVGGYASFPVLYMAQISGIPSMIQEQNSFAGKSNKLLGRKASRICVAYDHMERFFPKEKIVITGNPVRQSIVKNKISKSEACNFFKLDEATKIVFVFGGSLGAKSINETLILHFNDIVASGAQLIWQTGSHYYQQATSAVKGFESSVKVFDFIGEMDQAYAAADIIVARAGASSISELCIVGKPVIFVPFPFASEDHQTHNAKALVEKMAAMMVKDEDAKVELIPKVVSLMNDEKMCSTMRNAIEKLAIRDADARIVNQLIEIVC